MCQKNALANLLRLWNKLFYGETFHKLILSINFDVKKSKS